MNQGWSCACVQFCSISPKLKAWPPVFLRIWAHILITCDLHGDGRWPILSQHLIFLSSQHFIHVFIGVIWLSMRDRKMQNRCYCILSSDCSCQWRFSRGEIRSRTKKERQNYWKACSTAVCRCSGEMKQLLKTGNNQQRKAEVWDPWSTTTGRIISIYILSWGQRKGGWRKFRCGHFGTCSVSNARGMALEATLPVLKSTLDAWHTKERHCKKFLFFEIFSPSVP